MNDRQLGGMDILIIEDNPSDSMLIEKMLNRGLYANSRLHTVRTLAEGLEWIACQPVSVILLDLGLPDSIGISAVRRVLRECPDMPVVVLTGQDDGQLALEALREGAQDYLVKGRVNADVVTRAMRYAMERCKTETALRESLQRRNVLERVVNNSPAIAFVWRLADNWPVEFVSENIRSFGYAPEDFYSDRLRFADIVYPEDLSRIESEVTEYAAQELDYFTQEYRIVTRQGDVRWVDDWTWGRKDSVGDASFFEGVLLDVTERRRLEAAVLDVSSREQQRIGQDLHDSLGQLLTGIAFKCKALQQQLSDDSSVQVESAAFIGKLVNEAITRAQGLAKGLYPVGLDKDGLMPALEGLARNIEKMFALTCRVRNEAGAVVFDIKTATQLYWIAHEAIANAVKHADATRIDIWLGCRDQTCWMRVQDNGSGFKSTDARPEGMGLHIMRSRANVLGGVLDIQALPKGGTAVICTFMRLPREKET
jgi:PAS domain S-box-containing protein